MKCATDLDLYGQKISTSPFKTVKEYKTFRTELKHDHHQYVLILKMVLLLGLVIMAIKTHYFDFIKKHTGLFIIEIVVFIMTSAAAFVLIHWMRQWKKSWPIYLRDLAIVSIITAITVIAGEMGGWFALLDPKTGQVQQDLPNQFLWTLTIVLIVSYVLFCLYIITTGTIIPSRGKIVIPGLLLVFFISTIIVLLNIHTDMFQELRDRFKLHVPAWCLGLALLCTAIYIALFLYTFFSSIFRVHSFNIYSYLANTNICGDALRSRSIGLFLVEAIMVSILLALPLFLVGWDRTHARKDPEAVKEFFLLFLKLFLFYIMLQFVGFFEEANQGYCRTKNGCNRQVIKIKK